MTSAFSFFVFLLEFLLRQQKAAKDQFLRNASYATIIKSQCLGFTKQKGSATRLVPCSGDLCFFLFRFSFGVSSTRTKSNERSVSQHMPPLKSFYPGLTKQKRFTTRCVPSSNSGDLCFFLFPFFCGVSSTRTKNNERSISQNRLIGHAPFKSPLVIADTGFYETKRFFDEVGAFIHLW